MYSYQLVSLPPQERRGSRRFVISARDQWAPVWICFVCDKYFSGGGDGVTREGNARLVGALDLAMSTTEYGHVAKLITQPPPVYLAAYPLCIQTDCGFTCILCVQTPPGVYLTPRGCVEQLQRVQRPALEDQ